MNYLHDANPIDLHVVQSLIYGGNSVIRGSSFRKDCPLHVALMNPTITAPIVNFLIAAGADLGYISKNEE